MSKPAKILVNYTTRSRPDRFFDGMNSIYDLCADTDNMMVLISADFDDKSMFNPDVAYRIKEYKNAHIIWDKSESKIHAINRDLDRVSYKWDIVVNFSDDQRFVIYGWDNLIRTDFANNSPDYSHYMAYLDTDTNGALSTLLIAGRKWYDLFGFIYDPQFKSLWCDVLLEECARHLNKFHYTGYTIYKHLLPSYGHLPPDEMYEAQQQIGWTVDMALYNEIKDAGIENYLKQFGL